MLFAEGKNSNLFKGTQENTWVFEQLKRRLDSNGYKIYTAVQIQNEVLSIVFQFAQSMGMVGR